MIEIDNKQKKEETFKDVLIKLGIPEYEQMVCNSNSNGEMMHLYDYFTIADSFSNLDWFREWFIAVVEDAKKCWDRPQSIYQHIGKILCEQLKTEDMK